MTEQPVVLKEKNELDIFMEQKEEERRNVQLRLRQARFQMRKAMDDGTNKWEAMLQYGVPLRDERGTIYIRDEGGVLYKRSTVQKKLAIVRKK